MGFKEDLQRLSLQINERKAHIVNEEMTKQALIIPFIQVLGYDVFNPLEVKPEYVADFGIKKGEKVDYALYKDKQVIAFIEAKSVNDTLQNKDAQLSRYFNAVPDVKLGIITNGVEYRFFTDLTTDNVMDITPFLTVNLLDLKDVDIETLSKFKKDAYAKENLFKFAEELVYTNALNEALKMQFKNPSDEFIRFLIKDFSNIRVTSNVIERFRPIVKTAISNAILDIVSKGLIQQEGMKEPAPQPSPEATNVTKSAEETEAPDTEKVRIPSEDELKAFHIVKGILSKAGKDTVDLNYKDTVNYFTVYNKGITRWFLRMVIDSPNKYIGTRLDLAVVQPLTNGLKSEEGASWIGTSKICLTSVDDLNKLDKLIVKSFEGVMQQN